MPVGGTIALSGAPAQLDTLIDADAQPTSLS